MIKSTRESYSSLHTCIILFVTHKANTFFHNAEVKLKVKVYPVFTFGKKNQNTHTHTENLAFSLQLQ